VGVLPDDSSASRVLAVLFRRAIHDNSTSGIVRRVKRVIGLSLLLFKVAEKSRAVGESKIHLNS
jgi:hypothetical protein